MGNEELTQLIIVVGRQGGWTLHRVLPGAVNDGTDRPSHETNASLTLTVRLSNER